MSTKDSISYANSDEVFLLQSSRVTREMSDARGKMTTVTIRIPHFLFTVLHILTAQCLNEAL